MSKEKKSKVIPFILVCFVVYFGYTFFSQQSIIYSKNIELKELQDRVKQEQETNVELNKQKEMISGDEYIEKIAREKLGMVKQGEKVYIDINR